MVEIVRPIHHHYSSTAEVALFVLKKRSGLKRFLIDRDAFERTGETKR
jgi:hypothetical protein